MQEGESADRPIRAFLGKGTIALLMSSSIVVAVYVAFPVFPSNRSHSMRATRPRRPGWDIGGSGQAGEAGLAEGIALSVGK